MAAKRKGSPDDLDKSSNTKKQKPSPGNDTLQESLVKSQPQIHLKPNDTIFFKNTLRIQVNKSVYDFSQGVLPFDGIGLPEFRLYVDSKESRLTLLRPPEIVSEQVRLSYIVGSGGEFHAHITTKRFRESPRFNAVAFPRKPPPEGRIIILPGNYSGDAWAAAMCLVLDEKIQVVIPSKKTGRFSVVTEQFLDFCKAIGVQERVHRDDDVLAPNAQKVFPKNAKDVIKKLMEKGRLQKAGVCGWSYATSSLLLEAAIRQGGFESVLQELGERFVPKNVEPAPWAKEALNTINKAGECVLVNMRIGREGNHPQHDMTEAIYTQLQAAISGVGLNLVRIGGFQNATETPGGQWMCKRQEKLIELFRAGQSQQRVQVALFWKRVAECSNVRGIIGGRSGSLDIAALMGVRTLCWDIPDISDHEYVRQLLYFPIMSIMSRAPIDKGDQDINKKKKQPGGLVDPLALDAWLRDQKKYVIPRHSVEEIKSCKYLARACEYKMLNDDNHKRLLMFDVDLSSLLGSD